MKRESRDALITWRGFGNTNKKRIQKVKEIEETDKWKEKGEKKRRKKKINRVFLAKLYEISPNLLISHFLYTS